jgi:Zn finger protein HypA/HybF involved in hydrogenase expression
MTEDLRVTCDQCGSWQIQHRRKYPLAVRKIRLSDWAINEVKGPKTEPSILRTVPMVAECQACHFTVEYNRMESS